MEYTVVLQEDEEGNWLASVPAIPGCHTWGHTKEEALANAREAIEGCLESLAATGDALPQEGRRMVTDWADDGAKKLARLMLHPKHLSRNPNTTIVFGAGASMEAGVQSQDFLAREVAGDRRPKCLQLAQETFNCREEQVTLEMICSVAIQQEGMDEREVQRVLQKHVPNVRSSKWRPPLSYELAAHMMAHGMVKNVISMNFDELLERSLNDELGEGGYRCAVFEEVYQTIRQREFWRGDSGLDLDFLGPTPNLFKPHGSVSFPDTLRSTVAKVRELPSDVAEVLKEVLYKSRVVILVGYACKDPDFHKLLHSLPAGAYVKPALFWVECNLQSPPPAIAYYREMFTKKGFQFTMIYNRADDFFLALAKALDAVSTEGDQPTIFPKVTRHEVRHWFFSRSRVPVDSKLKFQIEIVVDASKARRVVGLEGLFACRKAINLIKELSCQGGSPKAALDEIVGPNEPFEPIGSTRLLVLRPERLTANYLKKFLKNKNIKKAEVDELRRLLDDLSDDFDIEVVSGIDPMAYLEFRAPKEIQDLGALRQMTLDILEDAGDALMCVSESGDWLREEPFRSRLRDKNLCVVVSSYEDLPPGQAAYFTTRNDQILKDLAALSSVNLFSIPWRNNTTHMTLNGKSRAIYFKREQRATQIAPYLLEGQDYTIAEEKFKGILGKSRPVTLPPQK